MHTRLLKPRFCGNEGTSLLCRSQQASNSLEPEHVDSRINLKKPSLLQVTYKFHIKGFILGTYKHDGFGSQWAESISYCSWEANMGLSKNQGRLTWTQNNRIMRTALK